MVAGGNAPIDVDIKVNVKNLQAANMVQKQVNAQVKQLEQQWAKVGKQIRVNKVQIKAMDSTVNSLGNHLGFVAFQWMFISGIAQRSLMMLRMHAQQIVETGAKGYEAILRATKQSEKFGESTERNAIRTKALQNFIISMSQETGQTLTDTANAVKEVGKALQDVNGVIPVTKEVLKMATIEEMNFADASKAFIGVMNNYKRTITDVSQITHTLVGVNQMSRLSLQELTHAFEFSAATASDMGMTLEETGTMLGVMGDKLTPGRIGRQFATMLEELRAASLKMGPQMEAMGISVYNAEGGMRNMPELLHAIAKNADEAGAGGKKFRDQFIDMMKLDKVSKRAMLGLINDMQSYDDAYKMLTSEEMKGRVEELYDTFRNTPEANINKMKAALEVLQTQFVGGLAPAITEVTLSMKELLMVSEINDIIHEFGKALSKIVIPLMKVAVVLVKGLSKQLKDFKSILPLAAAGVIGLVTVLTGMLIVSQLIMGYAVFGAMLEKLGIQASFAAAGSTSLVLSLFRLLAVVAVAVIAFMAIRAAIVELRKGVENADPVIAALGVTIGIAAIAVLAFVAPWAAVGVALAIALPLIYEGVQALMKMAGVRPGDDFAIAMAVMLNSALKAVNDWGEDVAAAMYDWMVESFERQKEYFNENWGWIGEEFGKLWIQLEPTLAVWYAYGLAALEQVWEGLKAAIPALQDLEDWFTQIYEDLERQALVSGTSIGEVIGTAIVDGMLTALGPVGWLLKKAMGVDLDKTIQQWRNEQGTGIHPQDFIGPKGETGLQITGSGITTEVNREEFEAWRNRQDKGLTTEQYLAKYRNEMAGVTGTKPTFEPGTAITPSSGSALTPEQQAKLDEVTTDLYEKKFKEGGTAPPLTSSPGQTDFEKREESLATAQANKDALGDKPTGIEATKEAEAKRIAAVEAEAAAALAATTESQKLVQAFAAGELYLTNLNEAERELAIEVLQEAALRGEINGSLVERQAQVARQSSAMEQLAGTMEASNEIVAAVDAEKKALAVQVAAETAAIVGTTLSTTVLDKTLQAETLETKKLTEELKLESDLVKKQSLAIADHTQAVDYNKALIDLNSKLVKHNIDLGNARNLATLYNTQVMKLLSMEIEQHAKQELYVQNSLMKAGDAMLRLAQAADKTVYRLSTFKMTIGYKVSTDSKGNKFISDVWANSTMAGFGSLPSGINTATPQVSNLRSESEQASWFQGLSKWLNPEGEKAKSITVNVNVERVDAETDIDELANKIAEEVDGADTL